MKEKAKDDGREGMEIKVDYSHLNVEDLMAQIKKRLDEPVDTLEADESVPDFPEPNIPVQPPDQSGPTGIKGKIKKILLKIMRPFAPVMKLMILPVYEEFMETNRTLHWTNMRLDHMNARVDRAFKELSFYSDALNNLNIRIDDIMASMRQRFEGLKIDIKNEFTDLINERIGSEIDIVNKRLDKVSKSTNQRLDRINKTTNKRIDYISDLMNERLDKLFGDFDKSAEFTKLLHNLSHNIVVELTKLKIEEEHLKLKTRIMEKDFEFLSRKEKALEEKIFA